jgi:hypothetical protein
MIGNRESTRINANPERLDPESLFECAVERRRTPVGELSKPTRQLSLQPVAAEAGMEAMKCSKPLAQKAPERESASEQAVISMNIEQVPKPSNADADPAQTWGRLP